MEITSNADHPAAAVLKSFFGEMNQWETELLAERAERDRLAEALEEREAIALIESRRARLRERLVAIFDRYCEVGRRARRLQGGLHCGGEEPDYNPLKEHVLSVDAKPEKVVIETQMTHQLSNRLRYEMAIVDGGWKVKDNRKFLTRSGKWARMDL